MSCSGAVLEAAIDDVHKKRCFAVARESARLLLTKTAINLTGAVVRITP